MIHCYKLCGYNIVLDVASGSVHSVDDVAYDVIRMYEFGGNGEDREELIKRVMDEHAGVTKSDVLEVIADVEMLRSRGKLFSPDIFADVAAVGRKAPLKALCLNVSHLCNMSCAYCFAGFNSSEDDGRRKDWIAKPVARSKVTWQSACNDGGSDVGVHREYGGGELMSLETGKRAIDFLVESSGGRKTLDVDFFGGEPLLNWEVIKDVVKYARSVERRGSKKFRFTLTTNALLIDDDVIDFTNKEMHNVVLSLDGRPDVHDAMRKLPNGDGSYSVVVDKIRKLVDARRGKGYYIRGTFTRENMDFTNDILHIADLGFKELSMEPVVTKSGDPNTEGQACCVGFTHDDLPELCRQYETLAVEMLRREKLGKGFTFYHYILDLTGGPCVHKRLAGCGVATEYLAVTPCGELYPCHQFVGDSRFLMGDVWRGVVNHELRNEFSECNIYSRTGCRDCWARFYCSGGCAANAFHASGSVGGLYEFGCELFKKRIECAIMMHVARNIAR